MMQWLSAWLFNPPMALGAAAVASPILIHFLSRRRFRRVRWAAVEFLLAAHAKNRRRVQVEQLLLLALRCLAVLLLALMIARPFVRPGAAAALLGAGPRSEYVVLLDDSFSMAYRQGDRTVFQKARSAVAGLARWLADESPRDALTLLLTSRPTEPLAAWNRIGDVPSTEWNDLLDQLTPSQRPADPAAALSAIAEMLARRPSQANAVVCVVSDFQRVDWSSPSRANTGPAAPGAQTAPAAGIAAPLAGLTRAGQPPRLVLLDVSADAPANLAVTDVRPATPQLVSGVPGRVDVRLANYSTNDAVNVELALSIADQALPPMFVPRIPSASEIVQQIEVTFPRSGPDFLRVQALTAEPARSDAAPAGLSIDDERAWAGEVLDALRVLVVDGEPSNDPYRDEVYLLRIALRPEGRVFSGVDVQVVEETELPAVDLSPHHVVILANVFRLTETARQALERFVAAGGGLVIYAGQQLDPALYNETLFADGRGLLPGRVGDVRYAPASLEQGCSLASWDDTHPLFRSFDGPAAEALRRVRFDRFLAIEPASAATLAPAGPETASGPASAPAAPTPPPAAATVLARLNDPHLSPLVVERPFGRGRVVFVATTADAEWNAWPKDPTFVPFVLELVSYAARPATVPATTIVGRPIVCALDPNRVAPRATLRLPGDARQAPIDLDAQPSPQGGFYVTWNDTDRAGIYRFQLAAAEGRIENHYIAVNLDTRECNLTPAGRSGLADALADYPFEYLRDLSVLTRGGSAARTELWWPLLVAAIAVLTAEHGLAWWFRNRGTA